ncbi:glycosyltransferase family 2 protein [Roseomonas marmotae]|uniref:Glycosyltransferase family 2 protein n=1 Tax=Roseomonas marmotae TaxID=2768161 RepID=A0ABS3KIM9_9PROT|nr:glycosyltransferase [Roseomonas marmotae]MBO1077320.1 glycosyltransferase family 2 protein [Roseomonas marmotae]QTI81094.1 glycosyltransferase family 2 protein [Roseomonas marmotae]
MAEATAPAGEFRAKPRSYPRWVINFLAIVTFFYGLVLSFTLPWTIHETLFSPDTGLANRGPIAVILGCALIIIAALILLRWLMVQGLAFYEHDRLRRNPCQALTKAPFVSILVPAFNESETVIGALKSLIGLDYPNYEVIFVDDGSTDDTFVKAFPLAGQYANCTLRVYTKPNGGKWSSLNFAYHKAKGDLLLCVDADSGLAQDALRTMVPRILEPGVVAVSGQVTIRNRYNFLTRLQAAEYLLGNGGMRMALSALGAVTVVPGPIGLYRREIMERVAQIPDTGPTAAAHQGPGAVQGPLSGETFAEDFQLSLSALALGGRVVYEPRAYAYTKCPDDIAALMSQRYRWMRGTWQVYGIYLRTLRKLVRSEKKALLLPVVMTVLYPLDIYLVPLLNFFFWGAIAASLALGESMGFVIGWICSVSLLNVMTAMIYILEQDDDVALAPLIPILDLYQSILVNSAWVIAAVDEARGTRMRWS